MNFWEDFFSLDKVYIPGAIAFLTGFIMLIVCTILNYNPTNFEMAAIMAISFFVGNVFKANHLQEKRQTQEINKQRKSKSK